MATVTCFTAERSQQIEDNAIVSGSVVDGDLILVRHNGVEINAGPVVGPEGDPGPAGDVSTVTLDAAIDGVTDEMDSRGLGVVAHKELTADQSWTAVEGTWQDVTGGNVTFTPVVGRMYRFDLALTLESYEALTDMHVILDDNTGPELFRLSGFGATANRMVGVSGTRTVTAPVGWDVSKTFRAIVWFGTDEEVRVKSGTYPFSLTVTDVGLPPS